MASQTLIHGEDNREFRVMAAPGPEEVRCGVRGAPLSHHQYTVQMDQSKRMMLGSAISVFQVNWRSVWVSYRDRAVRGWIFKPLLALFILIPVGMFSAAMMQLQLFLCPSHK